jgi:hypothetical protein
MAEFDIGFKIAAHNSGREMCRLRGIRPAAWEPISDTLQTTERLADRAFRAAEGGEPFVVYFEAYTTWRLDHRWNILSKSALLSEREQMPTRTLVFILTEPGYHDQGGTFRLAVGGRATQQVWFEEICLWREQPEPWWEQVPGLMAMLPLCDHGRPDIDAVAQAAQAITAEVPDAVVRANLLTALGFFGKPRYPGMDTFGIIGREHMRGSPFYEEIANEGRVEARRADILHALRLRFGDAAAAEFTDRLNEVQDTAQLEELHARAITCRGIGGFRRTLRAL